MDISEFAGMAPAARPDIDTALPHLTLEAVNDSAKTDYSDTVALEPTNEDLRREQLDGLDPWYFEGDNVLVALAELALVDKERFKSVYESLSQVYTVGDLVLQGQYENGVGVAISDVLGSAEVELLVKAKTALSRTHTVEHDTDVSDLGTFGKIRALGGTALAVGGASVPSLFALPQWAQMGGYGLAIGGTVAVGSVVREVWHKVQDAANLANRGKECADVIDELLKKATSAEAVIYIANAWIDGIDLRAIKKSLDPDYEPFKAVVKEHQDSIKSHTTKIGEAVMASLRGEYYDRVGVRRNKNELWFNPYEATKQLLESVNKIDSRLVRQVWTGDGYHPSIRESARQITDISAQLEDLADREKVVLGMDNDVYHENKDDSVTLKSFNAMRETLEKKRTLAILGFIQLRQAMMRSFSPSGPQVRIDSTWPLMPTD